MATNPLIQRPVIVDPNLPPAGNPLAPAAINTAPVDPLARQASVSYAPVEQVHVVQVPQATFLGGHSAPAIDPVAVANAQAASQLAAYEQAAAQRAKEEAEITATQERMRAALEQGNPLVHQQAKDARFSEVTGGVEVNANARPSDWQEGDDEVLPLPDGKTITRYELRKVQNQGDNGFVDRFTDAQGWSPWKARTLSDLYSVGGMAANYLGGKKLAEKWLDEGLRWSNESQKYASENDDISNAIANGKVDAWVGNVFGSLANDLVELASTTAAGAALGGAVSVPAGGVGAIPGGGAGLVLGLLRVGGRRFLGKSLGDAAREMYAREYAKKLASGMTQEAARSEVQRQVVRNVGRELGAYAALGASAITHGSGEVVRAAQQEGKDPTELSLARFASGVGVYTALDVFGDVSLLRAMRGDVSSGIRREVARGAVREGATEAGQDVTTQLAGAGELPTGAEAINSFMAGMLGGGAVRGVSAAVQSRLPQQSPLQDNPTPVDGAGDVIVASGPRVLALGHDGAQSGADVVDADVVDVPAEAAAQETEVAPSERPITAESFPNNPREFNWFVQQTQGILSALNSALSAAKLTGLDEDGRATDTVLAVDMKAFLETPTQIIDALQRNVTAERSAVVNAPKIDKKRLAQLDAVEAQISKLNTQYNYAMEAPRIADARNAFIDASGVDPDTSEDDLVRAARRVASDADDAYPQQKAAFIWLGLQGGRDEGVKSLVGKTLDELNKVDGAREFGLPSAMSIDGLLVALDSVAAGIHINGIMPTPEQSSAAGGLALQLRDLAEQGVAAGDIRPSDYTHKLVTISAKVIQAEHAWRNAQGVPGMLRERLTSYRGKKGEEFAAQVALINKRFSDAQLAEDNDVPLQQFLGGVSDLYTEVNWNSIPQDTRKQAKPPIKALHLAYTNIAGGDSGLGAAPLREHFNAALPPDKTSSPPMPRGVEASAGARLTDVLRGTTVLLDKKAENTDRGIVEVTNPLAVKVDPEVGPVGESHPGASRVNALPEQNVQAKPTRSESKSRNSKASPQQTPSTSAPQQNSESRSTFSTKSSETTKPSNSPDGSSTSSDPLYASSLRVAAAKAEEANTKAESKKTDRKKAAHAKDSKKTEEPEDAVRRVSPGDIMSDDAYRAARQKLNDKNTSPEEAAKLKEALLAHDAAVEAGLDRHYVGSRKEGGNEYIIVANADLDGTYAIVEKDLYGRVTWRATAPDAIAARTMLTERGYVATRATRRGDPLNPYNLSAWYRARPVTRGLINGIRRAMGIDVNDPSLRWWEDSLARFTESAGFHFSNYHNLLEGIDVAISNQGGTDRVYLPFKNALQRAQAIGLRDSHAAAAYAATAVELQRIGATEVDLGRYLHALTARERHARHDGSNIVGTTTKKNDVTHFEHNGVKGINAVDTYLNSLTAERRAQLEKAARPMRELQQYALQRAYESGLMTKAEAEQMGLRRGDGTFAEGAYLHYVPLLPPEGRSRGKVWITGRKRPEGSNIANPLLMALDAATTMLKRTEHNEALANMAAVLRQYNDPREFTINISEYQPKYRPEQFFEARVTEGDKELKPEQRAALEMRWFDPDARKENTLTFRQDGRVHGITFHSEAGKRMVARMHTAPHDLLIYTSRIMHFLSSARTLVPSFVVKAFAWDGLMVAGKMQAASGNTMDIYEARRATALMYRHYLKSLRALGGDALRGRRASDDMWVTFFNDSGAGVAPGSRGGYEQAVARLRHEQLLSGAREQDTLSRAKNVLIEGASRYVESSHATESAFRLAAFRAYIEEQAGQTFDNLESLRRWARHNPQKMNVALQISRDITTDYSTHGASHLARSLYMFFNAAVRGARGMRDMFLTKQGQYLAAALIGTGVIAGLAGQACEGDDHDDRSRYLRLSQRDAQVQFCEGFGIPLSHELRLPYVAAREFVSLMVGNSTLSESTESIFNVLVGMVSPISIEAGTTSEKATVAALPFFLQAFVAGGLGVGRFGEDLESDYGQTFGVNPETGESMKKLTHPADHMRGRPSDPLWARRLTAWLYDHTGADFTPGRTTELARFTLGGFYDAMMTINDPNKPNRHVLTAGFENKYQLFELKRSFEENEAELEQRFVQYQRTGNDLRFSDEQRRDLAIIREAKKAAKQAAQIGGRSESQWYNELRMAQAAGDASREAAAYDAIEQIREIKNVYYGAALKQISRRYE